MASMTKTIVATGASSGLGFEAIKQLLAKQEVSYKFILGVQNVITAQSAYDTLPSLTFSEKHSVKLLPIELTDLRTVKKFASQVLQTVGLNNIDILLLNAALVKSAEEPGVNGSKIVFVSSGSLSSFTDIKSLDNVVKAQCGAGFFSIYPATKFIQLLSAHWWRRELTGQCEVLAVSPGAQSILAAFTRNDFPEDVEQIFLTSWGEWWPKENFQLSLDKELQNKWSVSKEVIEREELVD
ncbi:hypothetical protein BLS_010043 [Venturia inaequalis]|uniref:Uncharacterized protein n=1 Tax=Venturia inaequalis TaxID=5025 RepID=A0A8H3Z3D7_VENIN|nr:hypothetical protein BLS_010043 [Venturia inaequalis]